MKVTKLIKERFNIRTDGKDRILEVEYGIEYLSGNRDAYFTITGSVGTEHQLKTGDWEMGGCIHEIIKKNWYAVSKKIPNFRKFIALHCCDTDGKPMHMIDNGYWWTTGEAEYAAKYENEIPPFKPQYVADHFRITLEEAETMKGWTKEQVTEFCKANEERYKKEAKELLKDLGL